MQSVALRRLCKHWRAGMCSSFRSGHRHQFRQIGTEAMISIPHIIQTSILALHTATDAPWWATIAMSTVFARLSLMPLVRTQIISSRRLAQAVPEIALLYRLLVKRLAGINVANVAERTRILSVFVQGVNACCTLHEVSLKQVIAYPLLNIGMFMTFVYSVRDMIVHADHSGMTQGGLLWFADLTVKDPSFFLPVTALSLSYLAMDMGFGKGEQSTLTFLKDLCQSMTILAIPFVVTLPAGVFCYWIPSTLFAIAQRKVVTGPYGDKILNIPAIPESVLAKPVAKKDEKDEKN